MSVSKFGNFACGRFVLAFVLSATRAVTELFPLSVNFGLGLNFQWDVGSMGATSYLWGSRLGQEICEIRMSGQKAAMRQQANRLRTLCGARAC